MWKIKRYKDEKIKWYKNEKIKWYKDVEIKWYKYSSALSLVEENKII